MPPVKHAMLGASSAHRWLECPPSAKWEQDFPDSRSEAAAEGTLAHDIAEYLIHQELSGVIPQVSEEHKLNPLYKASMPEYVQVYVDYVMDHYREAKEQTPDAILSIEEQVEFSSVVPEGYGTADCILIADGTLQVFDLKYGKGVPVSAVGNPQIRLYALGAYFKYAMLYDIQTVVVHIVQPRLDSITSEELKASDLLEWAVGVHKIALLAAKGEGEFHAGHHCTFCRCKNVCRAYAEEQLRLASMRFDDAGEERQARMLSPEEIAEILTKVDGLVRWAKGVEEYALQSAIEAGTRYPGFKLVEGRSNRQIVDHDEAIRVLGEIGYSPSQLVNTKLKGIGDLEELVGKKTLAATLGELIQKPQGKPVLVPDSDKRPELIAANLFD